MGKMPESNWKVKLQGWDGSFGAPGPRLHSEVHPRNFRMDCEQRTETRWPDISGAIRDELNRPNTTAAFAT